MMANGKLVASALLAALACFLAGCTASNPFAEKPASATTPSAGPPAGSLSNTPPAVPISEAKFSFAPVTGAPSSVLSSLSYQLGKEAYARKIALVPSGDPQATYIVKGYLSAVGDPSGTILVYVWDVFDTSGRRVHRISGQETSASGSQDPWSAVNDATVSAVARRTIDSIVSWGTRA